MPQPYPLLYRLGFTPWEQMEDEGPLPSLLASRSPGQALDVGCGTGRQAVAMAVKGWEVTGVDYVEKPLRTARARAQAAHVADRAHFVKGDVTKLDAVLGDHSHDLVLDVGCMHGLTPTQQRQFATGVTAHTHDGSDLIILAAAPRTGLGPKGIDRAGLVAVFPAPWTLVDVADSPQQAGGPLKGATFRWYQLHR